MIKCVNFEIDNQTVLEEALGGKPRSPIDRTLSQNIVPNFLGEFTERRESRP
jgi:hypothetical protein